MDDINRSKPTREVEVRLKKELLEFTENFGFKIKGIALPREKPPKCQSANNGKILVTEYFLGSNPTYHTGKEKKGTNSEFFQEQNLQLRNLRSFMDLTK